jgi:tetratricopeptide repeat protein 21B
VQRVSKLPYVPEDAEEFERAWLALADIHVAGGKFDLAQVRLRTARAESS